MIKKYIITLISFLILNGCVSYEKKFSENEFSSEKSYIAIRIDKINENYFDLELKNLDTNEVSTYSIVHKKKNDITLHIFELPEGDYAVKSLQSENRKILGGGSETTYRVPELMMTMIRTENNSITYLGDIIGSIYNYDMEGLSYQIKENYYYSNNFKIAPLNFMTIGTKKESNFNF